MRNPLRSEQYNPASDDEYAAGDVEIPQTNPVGESDAVPPERDNLTHLGHGGGRLLDLHDWFDESEPVGNLDEVIEDRRHIARDVRDDALQTVELLSNTIQVRQIQLVGQNPVQLVDANTYRRRIGLSFIGGSISIGNTAATAMYYNGFIVPPGGILWLTSQSAMWGCCPDNAVTLIVSILEEIRNGDRA